MTDSRTYLLMQRLVEIQAVRRANWPTATAPADAELECEHQRQISDITDQLSASGTSAGGTSEIPAGMGNDEAVVTMPAGNLISRILRTSKRWHSPTLKPRKKMEHSNENPATKEPQEADCPSASCSDSSAQVLDMCCGPRMMWFDKQDSRTIFNDRRRERHAMNRPKRGTVEWTETDPDTLNDFTDLPFADKTFLHVVFDPPHFERSGKIGFLAMKYGWLDSDWREMIRAGFAEGFRVLKPGGTLIFKWTATENPVSEILKLTPMKPLYGHKSGKQAQTHWIAFLKPGDEIHCQNVIGHAPAPARRGSMTGKECDQ